MEVKDKVAIITGGVGGIGFATVQCLLKNGAQYVAILDILQPQDQLMANNVKILEQEFDKSRFGYYLCDVTNANEFTECYEKVIDLQKYVHILINNAGIVNDNKIDLTIDLDFKAVVNCTMIAVNKMGKHKGHYGGLIVNVASVAGLVNAKMLPLYSATKHAVISFVRSMKDHNETLGIRIVCMCPHVTSTNLLRSTTASTYFDFIKESDKDIWRNVKIQQPGHVASAIVEMIEEANEGDIWVAQMDEPPFNFKEGDAEKIACTIKNQ